MKIPLLLLLLVAISTAANTEEYEIMAKIARKAKNEVLELGGKYLYSTKSLRINPPSYHEHLILGIVIGESGNLDFYAHMFHLIRYRADPTKIVLPFDPAKRWDCTIWDYKYNARIHDDITPEDLRLLGEELMKDRQTFDLFRNSCRTYVKDLTQAAIAFDKGGGGPARGSSPARPSSPERGSGRS